MAGHGLERVPKDVLNELKSVRQPVRTDALNIPTLRYVAMETAKPALLVRIDRHTG